MKQPIALVVLAYQTAPGKPPVYRISQIRNSIAFLIGQELTHADIRKLLQGKGDKEVEIIIKDGGQDE